MEAAHSRAAESAQADFASLLRRIHSLLQAHGTLRDLALDHHHPPVAKPDAASRDQPTRKSRMASLTALALTASKPANMGPLLTSRNTSSPVSGCALKSAAP
jgi:hypothetical protein